MLELAGLEITVVPKLSVPDGIQAVRQLLPRCWFDHKVKSGLDALRNYRRVFDEKRNVFYDTPLHDWCSHGADAFRYLALTWKEENRIVTPNEPIKGLFVGQTDVTLNDMWKETRQVVNKRI